MNESERSLRQHRIDAGKTAEERNRDGQFATPYPLAVEIVELVKQPWPEGRTIEFLGPCIGTGSFDSAMGTVFPTISRAVGIEKDQAFAAAARELWGDTGLDVIRGDFTRQPPPDRRFDLLITNPPYVRHHVSADDKASLRRAVANETGIHLSGRSGL
jgi:predicted RNA methylase